MLHRSVTFTHVVLLLVAAVLAFVTVRTYEEMAITVPSGVVWVNSNTGEADLPTIVDTVERFARDTGVSVALHTPDLYDPGNMRHLYLAPGAEGALAADWLTAGYPSFGHTMRTDVHPFAHLEQPDPRGFYLVFGTAADTERFERELAGIGLREVSSVGAQDLNWTDLYRYGGDLDTALVILLLFAVTVTASGVLLNARSYGVLRLQGHSYAGILGRDLAQLARLHLGPGLGAAALVLLALYVYNRWSQLTLFAAISGQLLALLLGAALAAHAFALAMVHATDIPAALKGRLPARLAGAGAYLVRVPALVFVLVVIGHVVVSAQNVRAQAESLDSYAEAGQASRLSLTGSVDLTDDREDMQGLVAGWLRQADAEGQLVLTARERAENLLPVGTPRPDYDVLVVNDTYLDQQEVIAVGGDRVQPEARVRLLVPENRAGERDALVAGFGPWLEFVGEEPAPEFRVETTEAGQRVFTYGSQQPGDDHSRSHLDDPVVVVLPNGGVLDDHSYVSYATGAGLVFPDPGVAEASIARPPFSTYVNGLQMVVTSAADLQTQLVRDLRLQTFNLSAATVVLLMTAVSVCVIHVRTRAQTIFARHLAGWGFLAVHRRLLTVEGALAVLFVGWAVWRTRVELAWRADPANPVTGESVAALGYQPLLAVAIAASGLLLVTVTLAGFHRRVVREGASQA
ncbi:hypothetical protein [Nocardiopsis sp. NPDC006938]|uniref:hypothetical protein n=1 Tax=Nocardiopsis sp. NPDC006938 TaxID=3364337 RepID=UPI00368351C4